MTVPEDVRDEEMLEERLPPGAEAGWTDALEAQFGSVPWWLVSAMVHAVVLLLMSLIVVSEGRVVAHNVVIPIEPPPVPPRELPEPTVRDIFKRDVEIDLPEVDHHPVFEHEEVDIKDRMETENNAEERSARGDEDAISDVPLGGPGTVGSLGIGGGPGGCYGFRTPGGKKRAVLGGGGSTRCIAVVDAALRWLAKNQEGDGSWAIGKWEGSMPEECRVGVTGLALLAFLGAGHTEKTGKYQRNVLKAVSYLISKQGANGAIGANDGHKTGGGYNHAIAGLALAEAYGMADVKRTGNAAQRAVTYSTEVHQNPYGGWRYNAKVKPDTSVTGWFIMQLKSATIAGLRVNPGGFQGAKNWLDEVTDAPNDASGSYGGKARYQPGKGPTVVMTSVAMLGRQFMGHKRFDPLLQGGADYLMTSLPSWDAGPSWMFYYWYYGTLVMFQMGGGHWDAWNASMRDMLIQNQINDPGNIARDGSWDPIRDGERAGRAYSTAMCALCLEVYYRYLPIYKRPIHKRGK